VDMSEFIARIINRLNYDLSISDLIDTNKTIRDLMKLTQKV